MEDEACHACFPAFPAAVKKPRAMVDTLTARCRHAARARRRVEPARPAFRSLFFPSCACACARRAAAAVHSSGSRERRPAERLWTTAGIRRSSVSLGTQGPLRLPLQELLAGPQNYATVWDGELALVMIDNMAQVASPKRARQTLPQCHFLFLFLFCYVERGFL